MKHSRRDVQTEPTKYKQYTIPGGKEYGELLMTLPVRTSPDVTWNEGEPVSFNFRSHGDTQPYRNTTLWTASDGATITYQEFRTGRHGTS